MDDNNYVPLIQNKYKLINEIGSGSYSKVYKGEHVLKKQFVAIKFDYDEISKKLIENEIKIYLTLLKYGENNIVNIKTFGVYKQYNYIIMEWLPYTFCEYIKKNMDLIDINILFKTSLELIETLHNRNFIHRDIKPDNFLLNKNGKMFIIDLGLSCKYDKKKQIKNIIGSILFCSFNIHNTPYIYEKKDDIISLYYVFFYLFSGGKLPWMNICIENKEIKQKVIYTLKRKTNFLKYYEEYKILIPLIKSYNSFLSNNYVQYFTN